MARSRPVTTFPWSVLFFDLCTRRNRILANNIGELGGDTPEPPNGNIEPVTVLSDDAVYIVNYNDFSGVSPSENPVEATVEAPTFVVKPNPTELLRVAMTEAYDAAGTPAPASDLATEGTVDVDLSSDEEGRYPQRAGPKLQKIGEGDIQKGLSNGKPASASGSQGSAESWGGGCRDLGGRVPCGVARSCGGASQWCILGEAGRSQSSNRP